MTSSVTDFLNGRSSAGPECLYVDPLWLSEWMFRVDLHTRDVMTYSD